MPRFETLTSSEKAALAASVRAGDYNLLLGAGVSLDSTNGEGVGLLSGNALRRRLCEVTQLSETNSLQRAASALTPSQIDVELTQRFSRCKSGPSAQPIPRFLWKRIFTLNIDDVLDQAYTRPGNIQRPEPHHFRDVYSETRSLDAVPVIYLHGATREPARGYVFDRSAYAGLMAGDNAWMRVLAEVMPAEPFFVIGTSLDEVDVTFYLAKRTADTQRSDRGLSFLVEPYPDKLTQLECDRHGLRLYEGTAVEFFADLEALVPDRPGAYDLIPKSTRDLFPITAPTSAVISFSEDFERVPGSAPVIGEGARFASGHPPTWSDLARHWDVGRALTSRIRPIVEAMLAKKLPERALLVLEIAGAGKSTVLRRAAYDLAGNGVVVVAAKSISRLEPQVIAEALDLIDDPMVIVVDDLAEQAGQLKAIMDIAEKTDFVVLAAERSYRRRHITRAMGELPYRIVDGLDLTKPEAAQLISSYVLRGSAGSHLATSQPDAFAHELSRDPIAVASCKIKNDMRPLDAIATSTYDAARPNERVRYLAAAIAQVCMRGGARYEIIQNTAEFGRWNDQFEAAHPLPLDWSDARKDFVIPLNASLAERTVSVAQGEDVLVAFQGLAKGLASRVSRNSIRRRTPEARLAGRLFDYDDIVSQFLGENAPRFYASAQRDWQWNSRYWEQIALYKLSIFRQKRSADLLQEAIQHARHAVAVELHPHPLTTLGKVLLAQIGQPGLSANAVFSDAHEALNRAITIERRRSRVSVHAYVTLFRGADLVIQLGDYPSDREVEELLAHLETATKYFQHDLELKETADLLRRSL